eukprot:gnl/MRDRNA2_/MRDRNA2_86399_c1_seq1.p1 gnl/MRDRNA2_/MRDRNA2_86399_c1~~gnl/MRDRNA2_/MRDRNA2_86399_c1_seq1.p1  ORF type:complete len:108 (+),score=6.04 gnl/MRDRNA2_/MRDRNA2_86399_c1_seq1:202-525(+)
MHCLLRRARARQTLRRTVRAPSRPSHGEVAFLRWLLFDKNFRHGHGQNCTFECSCSRCTNVSVDDINREICLMRWPPRRDSHGFATAPRASDDDTVTAVSLVAQASS